MHYVYINNIGFYVRDLKLRGTINDCIGVYRDSCLLDVSEALIARGVTRRMSYQEAKIIVPDATWIKWVESDFDSAQETWLMGLAEFSDCIEPEDQHSAYVDLSGHPNPQAIHSLLALATEPYHPEPKTGSRPISDDAMQSHAKPRLSHVKQESEPKTVPSASKTGSGSSKWIAKALCESGLTRVQDLPTGYMYPASQAARERLILLGYPTLHHVAQIPLVVLQGQFPDEALTIFRAAKGGIHQAVEAIFPRGVVRARFRFDDGVDDQMVWDIALKKIARVLGEKLVGEDLQGDRVQMMILFDTTSIADRVEQERVFSKPMQSPASIIPSLRLMLSDLTMKAKLPPIEIRVSLLDVFDSGRNQLQLQGFSAQKPTTAMERVRTVFGDSSIQVASKVSEPRRKTVLKAWQHATGWM